MPATPPEAVLVWFRNDLRVHEQAALSAALADGRPVRSVYFLCEDQWDSHHVAAIRRWYVLESLRELGESLARLGVPLDIVEAGSFRAVPDMFGEYLARYSIGKVFVGREYLRNELDRDRASAVAATALGVEMQGFDHGVLVPPRLLSTGQGRPYTVFSPYRRSWQKWLDSHGPAPLASEKRKRGTAPVKFEGHRIIDNALARVAISPSLSAGWQSGEQAARDQLKSFALTSLAGYQRQRDFPAIEGTSMLSAALSAGTVSVAECWHLARSALQHPAQREGAECWIGELAWRDFYRQIMANFPQLAVGEPFRAETRFIQWSSDEALFQAWCEGRTGYPLVDAAQRQLVQTGWMHNRLRMVSAMFLTKNLFIDWRRGEQFFMRHLIDGDFAANNGGWQWSASTGTDAAPYFRVFSPVRQSQRFDPDGEFIRRYVPELAEIDNKWIHEPWKAPNPVSGYPAPVVDQAGVRDRVTAAFRAAKEIMESQ
ncbi:MAG: deoxyribodipyrimidine photo-lyase [Alcanivoracaceae bacterium]|nr:deoxyribodipyrimidine photo-lyase [Alcanivoracaceae bacterium]